MQGKPENGYHSALQEARGKKNQKRITFRPKQKKAARTRRKRNAGINMFSVRLRLTPRTLLPHMAAYGQSVPLKSFAQIPQLPLRQDLISSTMQLILQKLKKHIVIFLLCKFPL